MLEPEPEIVTVNGHKATLEQLTGFSEYFRALLLGPFSETKERDFEMVLKDVPADSEAWEYYVWHCQGLVTPSRKPEIRWLQRLKVVSYLSVTEPENPPSWFIDDLKEVREMEHSEYILSLWETLKIIQRTDMLPNMLPLLPAPSTADFIWQTTTPLDLRQAWSHFYLAGPYGALATKTMAPSPNFWKNLEISSDGLLPLQDWPEALILSGGSVVDCWFGNTSSRPGRDFDLWIWDEKRSGETLNRVIKELQKKRPDLMIWDKKSSIDLLFPGSDFHIQLLTRNSLGPWTIPFQFDLDYVRAYVDSKQNIQVLPECLEAWQTRKIGWWNPKTQLSADRLKKAAQKGFAVPDIPVTREKAANLPWFHPHKHDPVDYVRQITQCIAPTSTLTQNPADINIPVPVPSFYEEFKEEVAFDISEQLLTGEFVASPASFRFIAELSTDNPLNVDTNQLNGMVMVLHPQDFPAHTQFLLEVRKLEKMGQKKWGERFVMPVGQDFPFPKKKNFPLAKNRLGIVVDQEGQLRNEEKKISGMAEISFSLAGVWSRVQRSNPRLDTYGFYFRFDRIQLLDPQMAHRRLVNLEPLRVEYFGRVKEESETKSPE